MLAVNKYYNIYVNFFHAPESHPLTNTSPKVFNVEVLSP